MLSAVVTAMVATGVRGGRTDALHRPQGRGLPLHLRARPRAGEVHPDVDLSVLAPALAGIVLHRAFLLGDTVTPELVGRVLDEVILPAALDGPCS